MLRSLVTACAILVLACGSDGAGAPDAGAGWFDASDDSDWQPRAAVLGGAVQETAVVALGGKMYVIGGFKGFALTDQVLVYDPVGDAWSEAAPLPTPVHHANTAVVGGRIYVTGAMVLDGLSFVPIGDTWSYAPGDSAWTVLTSMPAGAERGSSFTGAIDGVIYVAGGLGSAGSVDLTSGYVVAEDRRVHPLAPLPVARDHGGGAAVGGALYAIGGRDTGFVPRVDVYDPVDDAWTAGPAMPTPRAGVATAVVDTSIVVIGGEDLDAPLPGVFSEVEAYDPAIGEWRSRAPMRTPRHGMGAAAIDGRIYVPGGATQHGFGATDAHEVLFP